MSLSKPLAALVAAIVVAGAWTAVGSRSGYTVDVVLPAATNLVEGAHVHVHGAPAGSVEKLDTRDGKAIVTISLSDDYAPLHEGSTARISYKALLGERILEVLPAPDSGRALASGSLMEGTVDRVELDQVLGALDATTRSRLRTLVDNLAATVDGREEDIRTSIQAAGPAVEALGGVLEALGKDGPAIRQLVTRLSDLTTTIADKQAETASAVNDLATVTSAVAGERQMLGEALDELPGTLRLATRTLDKVPGTVDAAQPLLRDLRPGMEALPGVARQLAPVLTDLRPTIAELRPTLRSLQSLLHYTPDLLDTGTSLLPKVGATLDDLAPALSYIRPYTPEFVGWFSNWGSNAGNYDSNGHYVRAFALAGTTSFNNNPGVVPPGIKKVTHRIPGAAEGQPWADANGSEMQ